MSTTQSVHPSQHALLAAGEPPAVRIDNPTSKRPLLIVCDHASNGVPRSLANLGLLPQQLSQHIAWDVGAAQVARRLGARLDSQVIYAGYSRLVIDPNRSIDDPGLIPTLSDGVLVPGNLGLSAAQRQQRITSLFQPYHDAIATSLKAHAHGASAPVLLSIHSFTPRLHGLFRPWDVGVLWDKDPRLAVPLLTLLRQQTGLAIGDNLPYSGKHPADYTVDWHAEAAGLAYVAIEIRQDLIAAEGGQMRIAELLGDVVAEVLERDSLYHPWVPAGMPRP